MMRKIFFLLFGLTLISCKSLYMPTCEENRECTTKRLTNKSVSVKETNLGQTYLGFADAAGTYVIHHKSERINDNPRLQDAGHVEEIIIELPAENLEITLQDEALSEVNAYFIRRCFCRGLAGTFPIEKGTLKIKHNKDFTEIDFHYTKPSTEETGHLKFKIK